MLTDIEIENFRGIKKLEIKDLKQFNLFSGKNNSSKTTILEAIFVLTGIGSPSTIHKINLWRDLSMSTADDLKLVFYGFDFNNTIKLVANGENGLRHHLSISPKKSTKQIGGTANTNEKENNSINNLSRAENTVNEIEYKFEIKRQHQKAYKGSASLKWKPPNNFEWVNANIPFNSIKCVSIGARITYSANLEAKLEELIINKKEPEIVKILKNVIDDRIQGLKVLGGRMIYIDIGIETLVPINVLGDGIRRLLMILLSIYDSKDGLLVIDEIGNGLHHSILAKFWTSIFLTSIEYNVQLFCVTHSYEVLKSFKETIEQSTDDKLKEKIRNYTIRNIDNELKVLKYDFSNLSTAIEQEIEIR